ncbi:MAG: N-acetyl-gamma-glutamyl-phosphate reductase [Ammonifex sp.]|jgi:N-acetyl-gamma-glutamyl-phosphate reductase|nr:MAG: N-acetyl-gamma-glutamyl-phosphate reductase [Ammonifex sp.]
MIKVGIVGATGYTGSELVRLLNGHPGAELAVLTSRSYEGQDIAGVFPHLSGFSDQVLVPFQKGKIAAECDVVFTALPHGHTASMAGEVLEKGKKLIDLGADFRFREARVYEEWYGVKHEAPALLEEAVYGLPELYRGQLESARLVANPGCYPTASLLGAVPLLRAGAVVPESIIVDAKSGVSGAGRQLNSRVHYAEVNENLQAYNVGRHRHTPEIEQELSAAAGRDLRISFTPHLVPQTRGILATIYAEMKTAVSTAALLDIYRDFYRDEFFIRVLPEGKFPQTKSVAGSNYVHLGAVADPRTGRAVIMVALDNLVKGASGQAVQNMNLMFGLAETTGLEFSGLFP